MTESYPIFFENQLIDATVTLGEWATHHAFIGLHMRREFLDESSREPLMSKNPKLVEAYANDTSILHTTKNHVYSRTTGELTPVEDGYLHYENKNILPAITTYYTGASNTETHLGMRFRFLLDDALFIFDKKMTVCGNYPLFSLLEDLPDMLVEQASDEDNDINISGIRYENGDAGDYTITVVNQITGDYQFIDISASDLIDTFVGFDVYKADLEIVEDA